MEFLWLVTAFFSIFMVGTMRTPDDEEVKFSDCPAAVRRTIQAESKGAKIETVTKEKDGDAEMIYWADVVIGGKTYAVGVLEDGTLSEMNLAVDEEKLAFDRCPAAVRASFQQEAFGENVDAVGRDIKYGVTIYQAVVVHKGKAYEIVVAEDGTLVEKVLVIDDVEVKFSECPVAVRTALHEHAKGGDISDITRSTGISQRTFEAEVKIKDRVYLIDVTESGVLISKSLDAIKD
jgi:hypothetical protein